MKLFVVVPTFNEARNFAELLRGIGHHASASDGLAGYHVIHVDDGSRDETVQVARGFRSKISIEQIVHPRNLGIGATFRDGLRAALDSADDQDLIILMEGDLTNDPSLIPPIVETLQDGADVVIASRYRVGSSQPGFPARRRLLSQGLNWFLQRYHPIPGVRDYSIFYRGYRVGLLRKAWDENGPDFIKCEGFGANAEILCRLRPYQPRVVELPQVYRYDRAAGNSALKVSKTIREYLRLFSSLRSIRSLEDRGAGGTRR